MSRYPRPRITAATVFFTVTLAARGSDLLVREVEALRHAVRATRLERPFGVDAWGEERPENGPVDRFQRRTGGAPGVLPDHMHCVWTLPDGVRPDPALAGAKRSGGPF